MAIRNRVLTVLLVAIFAVSPAAVASWSGRGHHEPDTNNDVSDGWLTNAPNTGAGNKVYFNGFRVAGAGNAYPSLGMGQLGTQFQPPQYVYELMFGVWKDCNADGYVGFGDNGLWEYRRELLRGAETICPAVTPPFPVPADWMPPHNDGIWIHEFLTIGWSASTGDLNHWDINDNGSRAWYDFGLPQADNSGNTCVINPPSGSMHSTGGLVFWLDCIPGYAVTDTLNAFGHDFTVEDPTGVVGDVHTGIGLDDLDQGQITFSDANRTQYESDSPLNQKNPWGEQSDDPYVQAWDCSSPPDNVVHVPRTQTPAATVNEQWVNASDPNLSPTPTTDGSPGGTANSTAAGFDRCNRRTDTVGGGRGGTAGNAPYSQEVPVSQGAVKRVSDGVLYGIQVTGRPTYNPLSPSADGVWENATGEKRTPDIGYAIGNVTGPGTPRNGGSHISSVDGMWRDQWTWTSPGFALRGYVTYYGFVSPAAVAKYSLILPKGATNGAYGAELCGTRTTGISNGFDCDKTKWWKDTTGTDVSYTSPYLGQDQNKPTAPCTPSLTGWSSGAAARGCINVSPYPGTLFNLRDIDCTDNTLPAVRETGGVHETISVPPLPDQQVNVNLCDNVS